MQMILHDHVQVYTLDMHDSYTASMKIILNEINQMIEIIATDCSRLSMYIVRGYNMNYYYYLYVLFFLNIKCISCEFEINYIYIFKVFWKLELMKHSSESQRNLFAEN